MYRLLPVLFLVACADGTSGSGSGDPRCQNGVCPEDVRDCGVGRQPVRGLCEPIEGYCARNGDCPEGQLCDREMSRCITPADDERRCGTVDDCFADERCIAGFCQPPTVDGPDPDAASDAALVPPDAGSDARIDDAAREDGKVTDGPAPDVRDAGLPDGPVPDAGRDLAVDGRVPDAQAADVSLDAEALDVPPLDMRLPDRALPDMPLLDGPLPDMPLPDGPLPDGPLPDGPLPDGPLPDLPIPDMQIVDMAEPDLPIPDAALEPDAFEPPPTPPRGIYEYDRLQIAVGGEPQRVAFHPDGDYFVVLERSRGVYVVDWPTEEAVRVDPSPPGRPIYWTDIAFDPSGEFALLTGAEDNEHGVVYRLDDETVRAGDPGFLAELPDLRQQGVPIMAVEYPWDGGAPVVLSKRDVGAAWNALLRDIDLEAEDYGDLLAAHFSGAGCVDLAFAENEFGGPGILVVCGENGADFLYYTEVGGEPAWRIRPGTNNTGNLGSVSAHPLGDYALVVSWSGRRLFRFEAGLLNRSEQAPNYSRQGIWRVAFQQEGQRALVVGRAGVQPVRGTVVEYRHDEYACPIVDRPECGLTNVSIPGFDAAPYNGDGNTYLHDAAFKPECDGGILVGYGRNAGYIIRFDILNGRMCP